MTKIEEVAAQIRDVLNDSTIAKTRIFTNKSKGFWDQLWTSLDTIGDTEVAIKSFSEMSEQDFKKVAYIITYGLLQALYLQQDAVSHLKESILGTKITWLKEYPDVHFVRTIRNESTGHPTKNDHNPLKTNIYAVINRNTISKTGFSYMIWVLGKAETKNVKFNELIKAQEESLHTELSSILESIQESEHEHKKSFKGEKLAEILPSGEPYSLSLIRQVYYDELAWIIFLGFKEKYELIKQKIEDRYGPLKQTLRIPGTELLLTELDRIFLRIEEFKKVGKDVEIDIGIYADALVEKIKELKTHLEEIDEEFNE